MIDNALWFLLGMSIAFNFFLLNQLAQANEGIDHDDD